MLLKFLTLVVKQQAIVNFLLQVLSVPSRHGHPAGQTSQDEEDTTTSSPVPYT